MVRVLIALPYMLFRDGNIIDELAQVAAYGLPVIQTLAHFHGLLLQRNYLAANVAEIRFEVQ